MPRHRLRLLRRICAQGPVLTGSLTGSGLSGPDFCKPLNPPIPGTVQTLFRSGTHWLLRNCGLPGTKEGADTRPI